MRRFEPNASMDARSSDDDGAMAPAGVEYRGEPAFWLGETRKYEARFFDGFDP